MTKLFDRFGDNIKFLRDPTRGGLSSVLNEIAAFTKHVFQLLQKLIPIDEQVECTCGMPGLDPLYVAN